MDNYIYIENINTYGKEDFFSSNKYITKLIKMMINNNQISENYNTILDILEPGDLIIVYPKEEMKKSIQSKLLGAINPIIEGSSFTSVKFIYSTKPKITIAGYSVDPNYIGQFTKVDFKSTINNYSGIVVLKHKKTLTNKQILNMQKITDEYININPSYSKIQLILSSLNHWFPNVMKKLSIQDDKNVYKKSLICSTIITDIFNKSNININFAIDKKYSNNKISISSNKYPLLVWSIDFLLSTSLIPSKAYFIKNELHYFIEKMEKEKDFLHNKINKYILSTY